MARFMDSIKRGNAQPDYHRIQPVSATPARAIGIGLTAENKLGWYLAARFLRLVARQLVRDAGYPSGISRSISSSQVRADMSDGARQSPRGDKAPPWDTLGPLGSAERLNWLNE